MLFNIEISYYFLALAIALLVGAVAFAAFKFYQEYNEENNAAKTIDLLTGNFGEEDTDESSYGFGSRVDLSYKWYKGWDEIFSAMNFNDSSREIDLSGDSVVKDTRKSHNKAGNIAIGFFFIGGALIGLMMGNIMLGFVIAAGIEFGLAQFVQSKKNKVKERLSGQLPGFLHSLKANIQASQTPEVAISKISKTTAEPLKSDLMVATNAIESGMNFSDAIEAMRENTLSKDLKFLCACILQATKNGANIEPQLDTIQEALKAQRTISEKIREAVTGARPAIILSIVIIPAVFLFFTFSNPMAQDFWFTNLLSWAAFIISAILYIVGIIVTRQIVANVKSL